MSGKKSQQRVPIVPNVTDRSIRNPKGMAELMLDDEEGEDMELKNEVLQSGKKTKEEVSKAETAKPAESNNQFILIIFVLIVIALVIIIVWLFIRQDKPDKEEEMRRLIKPDPRSSMPPQRVQQAQQIQQARAQQARQQAQQAQAQQARLQQARAQQEQQAKNVEDQQQKIQKDLKKITDGEADDETTEEDGEPADGEADDGTETNSEEKQVQPKKKAEQPKGFAEAMTKQTTVKKESRDSKDSTSTSKSKKEQSKTKDKAVKNSTVDDVLAKTEHLAESSKSKKKSIESGDTAGQLNGDDKALLDSVMGGVTVDESEDTD